MSFFLFCFFFLFLVLFKFWLDRSTECDAKRQPTATGLPRFMNEAIKWQLFIHACLESKRNVRSARVTSVSLACQGLYSLLEIRYDRSPVWQVVSFWLASTSFIKIVINKYGSSSRLLSARGTGTRAHNALRLYN